MRSVFLSLALGIATLGAADIAVAQIRDGENPFSNGSGAGVGAGTADDALPRPDAKPDFLVRMSKEDCRRLLARDAVPGAAYRPGVDVRGKPVASADLPGTLTASDLLPEEIAFELALNPLRHAGNPGLAELFTGAEESFGQVRYNLASGALTLNGRRLTPATQAEIVRFCRAASGG